MKKLINLVPFAILISAPILLWSCQRTPPVDIGEAQRMLEAAGYHVISGDLAITVSREPLDVARANLLTAISPAEKWHGIVRVYLMTDLAMESLETVSRVHWGPNLLVVGDPDFIREIVR